MLPQLLRAGEWFVRSGIQFSNGGVARYYRADLERNAPVSTEITGYAASTLVYLHSLTGDQQYLDAAQAAASFLTRTAWDAAAGVMPFEIDPVRYTYFFDCGIIVRGLLSVWRATGDEEYLGVAAALGRRMAVDFASTESDIHPILLLPGREPAQRDAASWSRSSGCYQLKAALAWWNLFEATGERAFVAPYERALEFSLKHWGDFLPGHSERFRVMDRLHAFLYFLEGLMPRACDPRAAGAIAAGIRKVEGYIREIGPEFIRSDVYAQLLRIRLYDDWAGVFPLDRQAACREADALAQFQAASSDPRIDGGFYFGRKGEDWSPYINPVSTAFAIQALALWGCHPSGVQPHPHLLI
ncbi:MAG TPA: hypothetical protein VKB88_36825 [Bryobacteraceae bacterium]|nr:hypothetical protein [Bryobacteraceae bacterium]